MATPNKRIVICSDGTWDNFGTNTPTNVMKIVQSINPLDAKGQHQVVFYDQGIGTYNVFDKWLGQWFGKGIEQSILNAYRFIATNYEAGDKLYFYGASRGAYTARSLAGLLHTVGILPKDKLHTLPTAYKYYRTTPENRDSQTYAQYTKPDISLMAVWDTVGATGAPTPIINRLTKSLVGYVNTHLSPEIKNAYQALAVDEKRAQFQPALWTGNINSDQTVEQVWFAGVHTDVCGGYTESGLSDIALLWMVQKSKELGLSFNESYLNNTSKVKADILGELHDSYSITYRWLDKMGVKNYLRNLEGNEKNVAINLSMHESVLERINKVDGYYPANIAREPSASQTNDRRNFSRLLTEKLQGAIQIDKENSTCKILDYSPSGGVRVQCNDDLDKLGSLTISSSRFAKTMATCVWKRDNVYGLRFAA